MKLFEALVLEPESFEALWLWGWEGKGTFRAFLGVFRIPGLG